MVKKYAEDALKEVLEHLSLEQMNELLEVNEEEKGDSRSDTKNRVLDTAYDWGIKDFVNLLSDQEVVSILRSLKSNVSRKWSRSAMNEKLYELFEEYGLDEFFDYVDNDCLVACASVLNIFMSATTPLHEVRRELAEHVMFLGSKKVLESAPLILLKDISSKVIPDLEPKKMKTSKSLVTSILATSFKAAQSKHHKAKDRNKNSKETADPDQKSAKDKSSSTRRSKDKTLETQSLSKDSREKDIVEEETLPNNKKGDVRVKKQVNGRTTKLEKSNIVNNASNDITNAKRDRKRAPSKSDDSILGQATSDKKDKKRVKKAAEEKEAVKRKNGNIQTPKKERGGKHAMKTESDETKRKGDHIVADNSSTPRKRGRPRKVVEGESTNIVPSNMAESTSSAEMLSNPTAEEPFVLTKERILEMRKDHPIQKGITKQELHDFYWLHELREYCKEHEIPCHGKKTDIMQRIVKYLDTGEVKSSTKRKRGSTNSLPKKRAKMDSTLSETLESDPAMSSESYPQSSSHSLTTEEPSNAVESVLESRTSISPPTTT